MTHNQELRLSLLTSILTDGPQPLQDRYLYQIFSDTNMNRWLEEHKLKLLSKFHVDVDSYPNKAIQLVFFVVGTKPAIEPETSDLAERSLIAKEMFR